MYRIIHIENFSKLIEYAMNNSDYISVCSFKKVHKKHLNESYFNFFEEMAEDEFSPKETELKRYQHYRSGQNFHYFKLSKKLRKFIKNTTGFSSWLIPNLPEDLTFYSGKKAWLHSISHENILYLYTEDKDVLSDLENFGCKMREVW